jgi:hypothetical protein
MRLTFRPAMSADFNTCVRIIRDRFVYDEVAKAHLFRLWDEALASGSGRSAVIEDTGPVGARIVGFGLSLFVSDEFVVETKTRLSPFIGRHIIELWARGHSPILPLDEIYRANDGPGLNVLVLHYGWAEEGKGPEEIAPIRQMLTQAFIGQHRGYRLKEFLQEIYGTEELDGVRITGVLLRTDYASFPTEISVPQSRRPYLVGITKREALEIPGSMALTIFLHTAPRLGLTTGERSLLRHALEGHTDEELADVLHVSVVTVKKRWEAIYDRVAGVEEKLLLPTAPATGRRGVEKRRRLLVFLREHPEELRP